MGPIVEDVAVLPERVKRELVRGEHARAEFAIRAQTALKEAMDQMGPVRHIDGLGVKRTTIHPELAARIRVKYGRPGYDPLHDPDFLKSLLRDNPFTRVQTVPAKLTLRVAGLRDSRRSEKRENQGSAGQHGAQPRRTERAPRTSGRSCDTAASTSAFPVMEQAAGAPLVLPR